MKKESERDIQTTSWRSALPDKNLTPTITGCDSGQTTDRKEEDTSSQLNHRFPSDSDFRLGQAEKESSELRLKFKNNLQSNNSLENYLVKNSRASEENSSHEIPHKA